MGLEPGPGVGDHLLQGAPRLPPEVALGLGIRGHQAGRIARTPRLFAHLELPAGDLARGVDDLPHRVAGPGAQVVDLVAAGGDAVERAQVRVAEVLDVDVVAHRRAVV